MITAPLMDPDENLKAQDHTLGHPLLVLRLALDGWLKVGGWEPQWDRWPEATRDFRAWQARREGAILS